MADNGFRLPRRPKALYRRVFDARRRLEMLALLHGRKEDPFDLLNEYRAHSLRGLTNPAYVRTVPRGLLAAIERLDEALQELHNFDPSEYVSKSVAKTMRSLAAKKQKNRRQPKELLRVAGHINEISAVRGAAAVVRASNRQILKWLELKGIKTSLSTVGRAKIYWFEKRQSEPTG